MSRKTIGSLLVRLGMDAKDADNAIKKFERNLKDAGRRMESIGKSMSIGFTAPFVLGIGKAIQAYNEEAQAVKRLEVALGGTSKALLDQAAALQKTTTYADDQVIAAQSWAAALGHSESQILSMTTAASGLAAGLGIDLQAAMEMLHKTTTGMPGALGKLIPEIKNMTKEQLMAGDAVKLVTERFNGFAEAAAKAGTGPLVQFQNRFGDLMEQFGEAALPLLNKIIDKFTKITEVFSGLSPETKKLAVEIGAIVALAGPILIITGNIIKMTQAVYGLAAAMKTLGTSALGLPAAILGAAALGEHKANEYLYGGGFSRDVAKWAANKAGYTKGRGVGTGTDLLLGLNQGDNIGIPAPPQFMGGSSGDVTGFPKAKKELEDFSSAWDRFVDSQGTRRLQLGSKLMPMGFDPTAGGIGNIQPGSGVVTPGSGLTPQDFMIPDADNGMSSTFDDISESANIMKNAVGAAISSMIGNLEQGGKSFGEFALLAVKAIMQVVQAELIGMAMTVIFDSAKKGGLVGLLAGIAGATAGIALVNSLLSSIEAPKLAQGGMAYGPTMAMVGDNPNAHLDPEVISPLSKLKNMIGGSGGIVNIELVAHGDELASVVSRGQARSIRRASGNVIRFNS